MSGWMHAAVLVAGLLLVSSPLGTVTASASASCPPAGTNASCAQVGGCGRWCKDVCACDAGCSRYPEGCCWDAKACPTPPPTPPRPPSPPHPSPTPPDHPGGPQAGPEQFHLSLGTDPSSMTVDFATSPKWGSLSVCELSTVGAAGPWRGASQGTSRTYTSGGWIGLLHRATLRELTPGHRFWYRCCQGSAAGATGCAAVTSPAAKVFDATAAPAKGALPVTIAAVADLGEMCNRTDGGCGNTTITALATAATAGKFAALVHAGDIA
jgi:hypothetical protein